MKIGIFGGSFNPPHKIHYKIASTLLEQKIVDKIIFVPTGNYYQKTNLIDEEKRYHMVKLMIKGNDKMAVSNFEMNNKLTYTYETLDYFKNKYHDADIYLIIGSDNLREIKTWKNYRYILENYKILVMPRNNDNIKDILSDLSPSNIKILDIEQDTLSSSFIRESLMKNKDLSSLLSPSVLKYIKENNLYEVNI